MKGANRVLKRESIVFSPHQLSFFSILTVKLTDILMEHLIGRINRLELQLIVLPIGKYFVRIITWTIMVYLRRLREK